MRVIYSFFFYLLLPVVCLRLLWRGIKAPNYILRWRERFALYDTKYPEDVIWFHAVSVGEAEALFPLIRYFQDQHTQLKILVTATTPTGSARIQAVLGEAVEHVYLPYDIPDAVGRFINCFKPRLAVIMETEIWPNLYTFCGQSNIPLYIINARLSQKSALRYQKIPALIHPVLKNVKCIATQSQMDSARFIAIGANPSQVQTLGNIKFDLQITEETLNQGHELKRLQFNNRFVLIAASTHHGEELIFYEIYKELKKSIKELLLLIVPRHPERFNEVETLCQQNNLTLVLRSSNILADVTTDVYLADSMGELKMLYAAADIAFIGGSMVPVGGHNLLEASAIGVPVLFGPFMANFNDIVNKVLDLNAAIQCENKGSIINEVNKLYLNREHCNTLVNNGKNFVESNRGVSQRICEMLGEEI